MQAKIFQLKKVRKFGLDIIKRVTGNLIKDYTITQLVVPFIQMKLGITSKILIITIIDFIQKPQLKNHDSDF